MELVEILLAAFFFAAGGVFMKRSAGAIRVMPTAVFLLLFIGGAVLQARAMRRADMGAVYIAVLGLEAAIALAFSIVLIGERISAARLFAVLLIVAGVAILRRA